MAEMETGSLLVLVLVHPFSLLGDLRRTIISGSFMTWNDDGVMLIEDRLVAGHVLHLMLLNFPSP
jgi:hypothetical protein